VLRTPVQKYQQTFTQWFDLALVEAQINQVPVFSFSTMGLQISLYFCQVVY